MKYFKAFAIIGLFVLLLSSGCGSTPNLPFSLSGTAPFGAASTPTIFIPEPVTPLATLAWTPTLFMPPAVTPSLYIPATVIPIPTRPTLFIPPTVTATPTLFVPRPAPPTSLATRALPPGVYIQYMRLDPPNAKQKQDITFNVRFFNNTGREQEYRWFVYIYPEGKTAPMGQTSSDKAYKVPPGVSELASFSAWKVGGGQPCTNYVGKVHWLRADGAKPAFSSTAGGEFALPFTVCP